MYSLVHNCRRDKSSPSNRAKRSTTKAYIWHPYCGCRVSVCDISSWSRYIAVVARRAADRVAVAEMPLLPSGALPSWTPETPGQDGPRAGSKGHQWSRRNYAAAFGAALFFAAAPPLAFRGPTRSVIDIFSTSFALLPGGGVRSLSAALSLAGPSGTGMAATTGT